MTRSLIPIPTNFSTCRWRIGFPDTGSIGLGTVSVRGLKRLPNPADKIIAFKVTPQQDFSRQNTKDIWVGKHISSLKTIG